MLQKLWLERLSWDESLPSELHCRWRQYSEQLSVLNNLQIPRSAFLSKRISAQIHGFSDASKDAYGACVYIRSIGSEGNVQVSLLCAKTRVAPLKTQTIPRLELCAAYLLSKLVNAVVSALGMSLEVTTLWCDSTIVLGWLRTQPNLLPIFESNRVARIQELTEIGAWRHVPTESNPADWASRGANPSELQRASLWWNGPEFLLSSREKWPKMPNVDYAMPTKSSTLLVEMSGGTIIDELFTRHSKLPKIVRILAYCRKFIHYLKTKEKQDGGISAKEYEQSLMELVRMSQRNTFRKEIDSLKAGVPIVKGRLASLTPFIDEKELLRVGGRLRNSSFGRDKRHPMILDSTQTFTKRLFEHMHKRLLHAGPSLLLASIREQFWPLRGRNLARKALHLELVSDLTKKAFIATLRRFASRRGKPSQIYSDNGTSFVGGHNELIELGKFFAKECKELGESIEDLGISWHFIPSYSPHFGGLWEAGVKATKYHLKRVAGNALLTYEEFCTFLAQIEALLNSRPLTPLSSDPHDLSPLTPAHFLIGRTFSSIADPDLSHLKQPRLSSWQRIQQLQQNLWERWNKEYISELQQKTKWRVPFPPLAINTLVLLKEDHLPPAKWRLGRVMEVHPGSDGVPRVASVRTSTGIVRRVFSKLCPLLRDEIDAHI
ncbi:PREDICTED: uncharacterized protein LOC108782223 [Cyphomyrmex costatus]|nr:PREDICTED: uncharacterized protein LOC108782223 [Cyphomyrmex costatus]